TFSKSRSLAGMRIGFAIGSEQVIKAINDVKYSYNSYTLNRTAIAAGVASLSDRDYFEKTCARVMKTREAAKKELAALGFSFPESKTNFLFVTHESVPAEYIQKELKKRDIYVRFWKKPRIDNRLRITIGTDDEMAALYAALREIIGQCR
ncbi:MAG: aminotransferase class I/II-fold pyridoxal phosphate-dependent enzyme, partial [Lachnospiraceae bacterium]|nr:aminotransferase class I/II-fold pyridoxal phosphate-dependent enzyme [Lachnospiraceae bacterium]